MLGKQNTHANHISGKKCSKSLLASATRSTCLMGKNENGFPRGTTQHTQTASGKKLKVHMQSHVGSVTGVNKQLSVATDDQIPLRNRFHVLQNTNQNGIQDVQGSKHFQITSIEKQAKVIKKEKLCP